MTQAPHTKEEFINNLKGRTKQFVLRNIKLFQAPPATEEARIVDYIGVRDVARRQAYEFDAGGRRNSENSL
jgi:hypothetical protein